MWCYLLCRCGAVQCSVCTWLCVHVVVCARSCVSVAVAVALAVTTGREEHT